jgi:phosphoglycerate dehydrogenase-like enzyme
MKLVLVGHGSLGAAINELAAAKGVAVIGLSNVAAQA